MTLLLAAAVLMADPVAVASKTSRDFALTADPQAKHWKKAKPIVAENGPTGKPSTGHRTEIRALWTPKNLYVLYTCPYEKLHLKPAPSMEETNQLWNWDVAEVFVGWDAANIHQYKEFQVSPQGEWVDLDIDTKTPLPEGGWKWNAAGFAVKARIDEKSKVWYGEMRIPFASIDTRSPKRGAELRANFYRLQGPPPDRVYVSWRPTGKMSYHVPEAFGTLRLE